MCWSISPFSTHHAMLAPLSPLHDALFERQAQERLWRAWQEFFLAEAWPKRDDFWAQMDGFFFSGEPRGNRELGNGSIFFGPQIGMSKV